MSSEWPRRTFGDLISSGELEIGDGYRSKNNELSKEGVGPIFLRAGHVTDSHVDFDEVERFIAANRGSFGSKVSRTGDVIVTTKGNSTGRVAFVTAEMPTFVYSPHLSYWRTAPTGSLRQDYLRAWSRSEEFSRQLTALSRSTDMAPYLSLTDQRRLEITIPPEDVQALIGQTADALNDRIGLLRQTNTTLEAIAQALFKSWFVDFDPVRAKAEGREPDGMDAATAALFPSEFEESEIGLIPKGWRVGVLRDLLELQRGFDLPSTQRTPGGYPIIAASGRAGSHFEPRVSGPGVVTGRSGVLGKVFLELEDFWPLNTTLWVRDFAESGPCFAYELLRRIGFGQFNAGSAVPTLNRNHVHGLPQVVPATAAIAAFETNALSIHRRVQANRECADLLSAVRDTLLPRLISGKLRIPEAEALVDEVSA